MANTPDTNSKHKNESEVILDTELLHQNLDCPKCSKFIARHLKTKREYIIPSMSELAKELGIGRKSTPLHRRHLEDAGIAKVISEMDRGPNGNGQPITIKLDFSNYEFQKKMPEDQILTETDNMIEMLDGTFITLEEAERRLKNVDWANGQKVSIYAGRN